jgi:O-methyltransferase domain/Dimerisation domain
MKRIENKQSSSEMRHLFGAQNDYAQMFQMIWGFTISQIVRAAALYSLAEHLGQGRATPAEIAEAESLNVNATFRFMRACASIGLLTYDGHSKFAATPLLNTLRKDDPNSMRGPALLLPGRSHWTPWGNLSDALNTGEPQSVATLGRPLWEYLADTPADSAAFTETMKSSSFVIDREAAELVETQSVRVAVDIGGASGTLIHSLMKKNPGLQGVVFDLSHVVPSAIRAAEDLGLQDRFSAVAGDFFVSVPPADLYLLKLILHDWDDDACISILKNCRRAIHPGGRIVVVEMLIGEIGTPGFAPLIDLDMLVLLGGRERHLEEYEALFAAAGFRFASAFPTSTPFFLIEAVAV